MSIAQDKQEIRIIPYLGGAADGQIEKFGPEDILPEDGSIKEYSPPYEIGGIPEKDSYKNIYRFDSKDEKYRFVSWKCPNGKIHKNTGWPNKS